MLYLAFDQVGSYFGSGACINSPGARSGTAAVTIRPETSALLLGTAQRLAPAPNQDLRRRTGCHRTLLRRMARILEARKPCNTILTNQAHAYSSSCEWLQCTRHRMLWCFSMECVFSVHAEARTCRTVQSHPLCSTSTSPRLSDPPSPRCIYLNPGSHLTALSSQGSRAAGSSSFPHKA